MNAKQVVKAVEKPVVDAAEKVDNNKKVESLARFGFVVNGVLHAIFGVTAIGVALGGGNGEIDQSAVLGPLGNSILGIGVLLLMSAGFVILGFWKLVQIILTKKARIVRTTMYQIEEGFKSATYIILGLSLALLTFSHDTPDASIRASQEAASAMLRNPLGIGLFWLAGLLLLGIGVNFIYRGVTRKFLRSLDTSDERRTLLMAVSGCIGYVSKGLVLLSLGVVVLYGVITIDPGKESGLDGAFKMFIKLPFGGYLLIAVGAGFIFYAIFSIARARYGHFKVKRYKYL